MAMDQICPAPLQKAYELKMVFMLFMVFKNPKTSS